MYEMVIWSLKGTWMGWRISLREILWSTTRRNAELYIWARIMQATSMCWRLIGCNSSAEKDLRVLADSKLTMRQ